MKWNEASPALGAHHRYRRCDVYVQDIQMRRNLETRHGAARWRPRGKRDPALGEDAAGLARPGARDVAQRGVPRESASVLREWTLRPVDVSSDVLRWREDGDRAEYDIRRLADTAWRCSTSRCRPTTRRIRQLRRHRAVAT